MLCTLISCMKQSYSQTRVQCAPVSWISSCSLPFLSRIWFSTLAGSAQQLLGRKSSLEQAFSQSHRKRSTLQTVCLAACACPKIVPKSCSWDVPENRQNLRNTFLDSFDTFVCSWKNSKSQEQAGNKVRNSHFMSCHIGKLKNVPVFLK